MGQEEWTGGESRLGPPLPFFPQHAVRMSLLATDSEWPSVALAASKPGPSSIGRHSIYVCCTNRNKGKQGLTPEAWRKARDSEISSFLLFVD